MFRRFALISEHILMIRLCHDDSIFFLQRLPRIEGLVVIDVVEGTALAALPLMHKIIQNRPFSFPSIPTAIAWARSSGSSSAEHLALREC